MRALIAFDKFKDSLSSPEAGGIVARALQSLHPQWEIDACPLTDGGEGFCAILTAAAGGEKRFLAVTGPRGEPVTAAYGLVPLANIPVAARTLLNLPPLPDGPGSPRPLVAIVEMAAASGLALLRADQRDPWVTSTTGTGELIRAAAAEPGVTAVLLGVGGSATNDLGLGALAALGLEFRGSRDEHVAPPVPARWDGITRVTGRLRSGLPPIRIACDVTNPLLGPRGAAAVYGPQKGLRAADHARLEHGAARLALLLCHHAGQPDALMDRPGAGAAGGIAFGLMAAAGATLLPGFDLVTAWLDLERRLMACDVVITGEGRFDESSLEGKGPGAVAARAISLGKPAHVFAGAVTAKAGHPLLRLHAITPPATALEDALRAAASNLETAVRHAFTPPAAG